MPTSTVTEQPPGRPPFQRLWKAFLTARVMVAQALLLLQLLGMVLNQAIEPALLATSFGYLIAATGEAAA